MKAQDLQFERIIDGAKQFVVPVFQRDYSWGQAQCEQLWHDIVRVGGAEAGAKHFLGSIVYVQGREHSAGFNQWLLIDGQQRLTTLTLLLIALRNRVTMAPPAGDSVPTADEIHERFLVNRHARGDLHWKLQLRRDDDRALRALIDREEPPADAAENVVENLRYFEKRLEDEDLSVLWRGIQRLVLVDVALTYGHDDPQLIFESLNSTGLELTQADLIRNYILMRLDEAQQTRLYEKYWSRIDDLFRGGGRTFDAFARDYIAMRTRASRQVRADDVYREFRDFVRTLDGDASIEPLLEHMLRFARHHAAFSLDRGARDDVAPALRRLNGLADVAAVLVMRLSDCHEREALSTSDFLAALGLVESYLARRSVCGMQTRGYWQTFASLSNTVDEKSPLMSLKVGLGRLGASYRFPTDEEFEREIRTRDLYGMRICHYLLDRLENHGSKEPTNTSGYSVEHVLPQNPRLSREWQRVLGDEWRRVQSTWLHRLGNLTLTGYNSTYSDRPFSEKRDMVGGFGDSSVWLNKDLKNAASWNEAAIEARGCRLAARALQAWPALDVNQELVDAAAHAELVDRSKRRDVKQVAMSARAQALFTALRPRVLALGPQVVEIAEKKSVSYHAANFFVEVLPRERRLVLLIDLDLAECGAKDDNTFDAGEWRFLANAVNAGGVIYYLNDVAQVDAALKLIRQAHDLSLR